MPASSNKTTRKRDATLLAGMHLADGEVVVRSMAGGAGFSQLVGISQRVRCGALIGVACGAGGRGWSYDREESPRILNRQQVVLQWKLLGAVHVALSAIAAV